MRRGEEMRLTNEQYDFLNKLHRVIVGLIKIVALAITIVGILNQQGVLVPVIVTTVLTIAQTILGELLEVSSEKYWREQENGSGVDN